MNNQKMWIAAAGPFGFRGVTSGADNYWEAKDINAGGNYY